MTTISKKEFLQPPEKIIDWKFPDPVTRESFAAVLARSFLISIGNGERQVVYLDWLKTHIHFDWRRSVRNFMQTGGWERFTPEEQERFMREFEQIKAHKTSEDGEFWRDMHENPKEALDNQLTALFEDCADATRDFTSAYKSLATITSENELVRGMNTYFYSTSLKNEGAIVLRYRQDK